MAILVYDMRWGRKAVDLMQRFIKLVDGDGKDAIGTPGVQVVSVQKRMLTASPFGLLFKDSLTCFEIRT